MLALGVTEIGAAAGPLLVGVLATGLVMFTLPSTHDARASSGCWPRSLSPIDRLLRDRVLELSFAETNMIAKTAQSTIAFRGCGTGACAL